MLPEALYKKYPPQAFHSAHDAQLLMDSVPPDKRVAYRGGVAQSYDRGGGGVSETPPLSSLIHPPPDSSDQCEVRTIIMPTYLVSCDTPT